MSDLESTDFSITAASNTAAPPNGAPEGWAPSTVNNWGRELMAAVKRQWNRAGPTVTSGGSANAQTLTYTSATVAALVRGQTYSFIAGFTNTGATTLKVDSLTATAVQRRAAALTGGEIQAGATYLVVYDGTAYQLLNPDHRASVGNYTAYQYFVEATLTHASPTTWNLATQQNAVWTITASVTLSNPTNMVAGLSGNLRIIQGSGGSKLITWGSAYIFPGGIKPTLSTSAGQTDIYSYYCDGSFMYGNLNKTFS